MPVEALVAALLAVAVGLLLMALAPRRNPEVVALEVLAGHEKPLLGLEIVEQSGGDLSRGTVYVWLSRLESRGLLRSWVADQHGRRHYAITDAGREWLAERSSAKPAIPPGPTYLEMVGDQRPQRTLATFHQRRLMTAEMGGGPVLVAGGRVCPKCQSTRVTVPIAPCCECQACGYAWEA